MAEDTAGSGRREGAPAGPATGFSLWRYYGWQIELFFKELKSTLGFAQYRFRRFASVEGWVQACLVTFCYLEWQRARQLRSTEVPEKEKEWWRWQRSFGLAVAVTEHAQGQELVRLFRWSGTKAGLKRLRQALRRAQPLR